MATLCVMLCAFACFFMPIHAQEKTMEEILLRMKRLEERDVEHQDDIKRLSMYIMNTERKLKDLQEKVESQDEVIGAQAKIINDMTSGQKHRTRTRRENNIPQDGIVNTNVLYAHSLVAFSASMKTGLKAHVGVHQHILYDTVITNIGNSFNPYTSLFTAHVAGLYLFSASVLACDNHVVEAALVKNGATILKFYAKSDHYCDEGSATTVLVLQSGDKIWTELASPSDATIYGYEFTSFSGLLISQM